MMLSKYKKFFHKSHDITNELLIIIHVDKISALEKTNFFDKIWAFPRAF
jgi:hypothetical protein